MSYQLPPVDWVNNGRQWMIQFMTDALSFQQGVFDSDQYNFRPVTPTTTLRFRLGHMRNGDASTNLEFISTGSNLAGYNALIQRASGTNGSWNFTQLGTNPVFFFISGGGKFSIQHSVESFKVDAVNTIIFNNLLHAGSQIAFFNAAQSSKITVTGSRGGNAAIASLLTALATYGLIVNSTTA